MGDLAGEDNAIEKASQAHHLSDRGTHNYVNNEAWNLIGEALANPWTPENLSGMSVSPWRISRGLSSPA